MRVTKKMAVETVILVLEEAISQRQGRITKLERETRVEKIHLSEDHARLSEARFLLEKMEPRKETSHD